MSSAEEKLSNAQLIFKLNGIFCMPSLPSFNFTLIFVSLFLSLFVTLLLYLSLHSPYMLDLTFCVIVSIFFSVALSLSIFAFNTYLVTLLLLCVCLCCLSILLPFSLSLIFSLSLFQSLFGVVFPTTNEINFRYL